MEIKINKKSISLSELEAYSPANTLIISSISQLKDFSNFKLFSVNNFCEYLMKKSPNIFSPTILSKEESEILIYSITKQLFQSETAMKNLSKSLSFSKEINKLFETFFSLNINAEQLEKILKNTTINNTDTSRFKLIIKAFEIYTETLEKQKKINQYQLPQIALKLLEKNNQMLDITRENCKNIFIDDTLELTATEKKIFQLINTNIQKIQIIENTPNDISTAISKKYLNENTAQEKNKTKFNLLSFNDLIEEAKYISTTILDKITKENLNFSDIAIVINNQSSLKIFNDTLNQFNIPTNFEQQNNDYLFFATKLNQYINICANKQMLEQSTQSKARKEELNAEINMHFENIISETLDNQFIKDKFLFLYENSSFENLIDCAQKNLKILNADDEKKLTKELEKIKELYNLYNSNQIEKFIAFSRQGLTLDSTANQKIAQLIKKINALKTILTKNENKNINLQIIQEILISSTKPTKNNNNNDNCVKLLSFKTAQNTPTKILFVPDLTEKSIPFNANSLQYLSKETNEKITTELKKIDEKFSTIIPTNEEEILNGAKTLTKILSLGQNEITISTHKYEDKKQIQPSVFFQFINSFFEITPISNVNKTEKEGKSFYENKPQNNLKTEPIIDENATLKLNASSISNFQQCPRKFYFENLLGLKSTGTFNANYGTIAHTIIEVFNKNHIKTYDKISILNLTNILFNANSDPQKALSAGFSQRSIDLIKATDFLSLEEMKLQFTNALDELEKNNFFDTKPEEIICEKSFKFSHPNIPNVIFEGRIDAIYKHNEKYTILDFKTGADKPKLSYLISNEGVNFQNTYGKETNKETKQKEFDYQIPLYYLACKYSKELEEIKEKIDSIGFLYVRPKNKHNGVKSDIIHCENIEEFEEKLIQNLNETIIEKIKNKSYFEPVSNERTCTNCDFRNLCEINLEAANE